MTLKKKCESPLPNFLHKFARQTRQSESEIDRREFLALASSFGATAATAYGMIGLATPVYAKGEPEQGGNLRIQQLVQGLKDPRTFDHPVQANIARGWLEYLVRYNRDGTFEGRLLDSWEISNAAKTYTLNLRQGVTWNNGDAFTAHDVAYNIDRWCDTMADANSMAGRFTALIDQNTGKAIEGGIEILDDHTVRLNLPVADITLIAGMADYPAAIVHQSYSGGDPTTDQIGTGPFALRSFDVGIKAVLVRNESHTWWGGNAPLDSIEFLDYGDDPAAHVAAFDSNEIDMVYESSGAFVAVFDNLGLSKSEAVTASTVVARTKQTADIDGKQPYSDVRVRRALALACDNAVVLELGYSNAGTVAENHHVCPIHPEYVQLPPLTVDRNAAATLMSEAGMGEYEHEIVSLDAGWNRDTADVIAAQLRDAGFNVKRAVLPGPTYWTNWDKFPFSLTEWIMRPLGIQVLALAYKSGVAWNETSFSNAEFDETLGRAVTIADVDERRELTRRLEEILQEQGVIIQPFWRSLFRHVKSTVKNAEMHPTFEIHVDSIWMES